MKNIILILLIISLGVMFTSEKTYAISALSSVCTGGSVSNGALCTDYNNNANKINSNPRNNPIVDIIKTVITIISVAIGIVSVIMIMIGGLRMILSNGDPQTIARSRESIIYAIIGIVVAITAEGIVIFVVSRLA